AAAFVEHQMQRVIARGGEIESLQGIAGTAWIGIRDAEAPDSETEAVVAADAEGPVPRSRNRNRRRGLERKVVLVHPDCQSGKRAVVAIVPRRTSIEVIDDGVVFSINRQLL